MIQTKHIGHDYQYEIDEIINLFINDRETFNYEIVTILELEDSIYAKAQIYLDSKLVSEHSVINVSKPEQNNEVRKLSKRLLKISLFKAFKEIFNKDIPWGILTGIRPTKIVHELFEEGMHDSQIYDILTNTYEIQDNKARLLIDIAHRELKILKSSPKDSISIYVGIPFCPTRCLYCSFTSNPLGKYSYLVDNYVEALVKEIQCIKEIIIQYNFRVQSIYVGGGTPSSLNENQMTKLLDSLDDTFGISKVQEFTFEAGRPDTITIEKLKLLKKYGVERISINPQTMNDKTLEAIGRLHTSEQIIDTFKMAREVGFNSINADVIIGLPGEETLDVETTMNKLLSLDPDNLTVHTMAVKRASNLKQSINEFVLTEAEKVEKMLQITKYYSEKMDMYPYYMYRQKNMVGNFENVGYCKSDKECIYNIQIMDEQQSIFAVGAGAVSKIVDCENNRIERIFNVKNVEEYIARIDEMIEKKKNYKYI